MKVKQESSGYPDWCKTEQKQDKDKFKRDYLNAEGISLESVEKNPGLRAVAKFKLDSLWGKPGQREKMTKTEYISEPSKYLPIENRECRLLRRSIVHVDWEDTESLIEPHTCSNVVMGSFVTAQARLKLYGILKKP